MAALLALCLVVSIYDGDGPITCRDGTKLRLAGIQAPDFQHALPCRQRQRGYVCDNALARRSRDNLRKLAPKGSTISYRIVDATDCLAGFQGADLYGRKVVRAYARGVDLGEAQVRGGFAVRWRCGR